ncbi:MAG: sensor histidine kinase, partial [Lewinella sp.]
MSWITNIKRSDWLLIGIYYCLAFVITFFAEWVEEDIPLFTTQSLPLLKHLVTQFAIQVISVIVIVFGVFATFFPSRRYFPLFGLILLVLFVQVLLQYLLLSSMGPLGPDYVANILWGIIDNFSDVTPIALFLMAKQYYTSQNQLLALERNQKDAELRQLETQVDPHFLFNSLNILDILIEADPAKARTFTQKLSSLYRYLIRHRNEEMVPLTQEWAFCQDYIYLLEQRFANLFLFETTLKASEISPYFIPPAVMQTLVENIVKHNVAFP